ncbi:MAG: carboxypeptidase regulatory-like domain-containing protein [Kiritimatiellia bacterium]
MKRVWAMIAAAAMAMGVGAGEVTATSVTARQRYPWNGLVDIVVTLVGASNDVAVAECAFAATNSATQAALPVSRLTRVGVDAEAGASWVRRYVWDAAADIGAVRIADVTFVAEVLELGGVQLWADGPYWAECNVGASQPEESGYCFWWGDTVGYTRNANGYGWVSVQDGTAFSFSTNNCPTYNKSISTLQSEGYIDATTKLVAAHDAATAYLGAPWRMPTDAEFSALISNCTTTWTNRNGVYGRLVTGKGAYASKSIFLPAAGFGYGSGLCLRGSYGCYWSSTSLSDNSRFAGDLRFDSGDFYGYLQDRYFGQSVRPVRESAAGVPALCAVTPLCAVTHLALDCREGMRYARPEEPLGFSTDWSEGATQLELTVAGARVLSSFTATNGVYVWRPVLPLPAAVTVEHVTCGTSNAVLTATFTSATYDVTFEAGEHGAFANGVSSTTQVVPHGEAAVPPDVTPATGYRFAGWSADISAVTNAMTVTAQYEAIVAITFVAGADANEIRQYVQGGTYGSFPQPTRWGYQFLGWYTAEAGGTRVPEASLVPSRPTTLYARWTLKPWEVVTVSGTVATNATWTTGNIYWLTGSATIASGATLTIEPGSIVKFASGTSLTVSSGARLDAQGTRLAPIYFTSIKDDDVGGDTNGDGGASTPQGGDWKYIYVSGTANLKYCRAMYGAPSNETGILETSGGTLYMDSCVVAHARYDGVWNWGGTIDVQNTVFDDCGNAVCPYNGTTRVVNCVMAYCNTAFMDWSHWVGGTFRNCIFYNCGIAWSDTNSASIEFQSHSVVEHCCLYNPPGIGPQTARTAGSNGNIWGDPLFVDAENGDFRIAARSPCVDAGDGTAAAATDAYGRPRMDVRCVRDTGVPNAQGICPDIGIYEADGESVEESPDLEVLSVAVSPREVRAGDMVEISYVVTNRSAMAVKGVIRDRVAFVADDDALGDRRIELGTTAQIYDLACGGRCEQVVQLPVPAAACGNWRFQVTVNAERDVYEQLTANNSRLGEEKTAVRLDAVAVGTSTLEVAEGVGAYELTGVPESGGLVLLSLPEGVDAYGANGYVPDASRSDAVAVTLADGRTALVFPPCAEKEQAYLTFASEIPGRVEVDVEVKEVELALFGLSPARLVNNGTVRLTLAGTLLEGASVSLVGGATLTASRTETLDAAHVCAVFELASAPVGRYSVRVEASGRSAVLNEAVELFRATTGPQLAAKLVLPGSIRDGRVYTAWIEYANTGDEDMAAPLFTVRRTDGRSRLKATKEDDFAEDPLHLVGIGGAYPAGVLAAGDSGRIPFYFVPNGRYGFALSHAAEVEGGESAYPQFADTADYRRAVAEAATRLNARGIAECRVQECVDFILAERAGRPVAAISGVAVDAATREPLGGVMVRAALTNDLTVTAQCETDADGRYSLGMLADGDWKLSVDNAAADGTNIVTVAAQRDVNGRTLPVRMLATVSGTVVAADSHQALAGAAVRLYRDGGEIASDEGVTDDDGVFRLDGVLPGAYALVVNSRDGYVGTAVTNVTLNLGGHYAAGCFELEKGAVLSGTVTYGGTALTNGIVYACFADGSAARAECATNGVYCFDGLPPYDYRVRYSGGDFETDFVDVPLVAGETRTLDLEAKGIPLFFPVRQRGYGSLTTQFMLANQTLATNATSFAWDFDNDGTIDSTVREPSWTYGTVGAYDVRLVVNTPQGARESLYEACVTVEEQIDNVLNANAIRVDATPDLDCTALGENTLTLVGTPPIALVPGVVVGGLFGGEWYIRRLVRVTQDGDRYELATEDAELDDLYASYCFASCQEVELVDEPAPAAMSSASGLSPMVMRARASQPQTKVVGGLGVQTQVGCSPRLYIVYENTRRNGQTYQCAGIAGEVALDLAVELSGDLGVQKEMSVALPVSIPTPVPFVEVEPGVELGLIIGASGYAQGGYNVSVCPRIRIAVEKAGDGDWKFAKFWDGFNFGHGIEPLEVGGKVGIEAYAKVQGFIKAFKVVNVGVEGKIALVSELSGGTQSAPQFGLKRAVSIAREANLFDSTKIPLVGKWLDFKLGARAEAELLAQVLLCAKGPEPGFVMSPASGESPLSVSFVDDSKSGEISFALPAISGIPFGVESKVLRPTAWEWDLGTMCSTLPSPSCSYATDGVYEISQKVRCGILSPWYAAKQKLYVGKPKPPEDPPVPDDDGGADPSVSWDPNEMAGPSGIGEARLVKPGEWMTYVVYFENKADADVPAQEVFVDAQLSEYLDWTTFEMGEVAFNNQNETALTGLRNATRIVGQTGSDDKVQLSVAFDEATGAVHWYLRSYDPDNADFGYWPTAVDAGFLPPNDETHRGEGHLTYRVKVREDAPTGARIDAAATIVFDYNDPIATDPAWWNTVAPTVGEANFVAADAAADEGSNVVVRVLGGNANANSSVKVYLTYNTAAAADLDLKNATVTGGNQLQSRAADGGVEATNLKFPLTLNWAAGEIGEKVIAIPTKIDKAVEDDEFFTLQLAEPVGMELGETRVCTVTVRDLNDKTLKAAVTAYKPKAGESVATNHVGVAAAGGEGGFVAGTGDYTSGSKLTLTAEARPGWAFVGWRLQDGDGAILSNQAKWQLVVTNGADYVAVFERIPYIRGLADPANRGKVTGSGLCAAGKKVTLKATANKGFVFRGWTAGAPAARSGQEGAFVATTPTLVIDRSAKPAKNSATSTTITTVTGDATYCAGFITAAEDKASIVASVDGAVLEPWVSKTETHALATNIWTGVYLEWPVAADALSAPTVKVAGLPSGLKFAAKPVTAKVGSGATAVLVTNVPANTIYGAPTAASKTTLDRKTGATTVTPSAVKVTVTTAGKSSQTYQIDTVVEPLPAWAQGTFHGMVASEGETGNGGAEGEVVGTVSLTVSAAGKVSGKAQADGSAYTLAAPYYSGFAAVPDGEGLVSNFFAAVTAAWSYKDGAKTIKTNAVAQMTVQDNGVGGIAAGGPLPAADAARPESAPCRWTAWQYNWKAAPWNAIGKSFDKQTLVYAILADGSCSEAEADVAAPLGEDVAGRVALKFAANGTATVAGEFVVGFDERTGTYKTVKASAAATLVPVDESRCAVFVYLTPKGLLPHARALTLP